MGLIENGLEWLHRQTTGKPLKLDWYMSIGTRQSIMDSSSVFGVEYLEMGELKYSHIHTGNPIRDKFERAVDKLVAAIKEATKEDEYLGDLFFIPAICTRLDAYMKVDGIQKADRQRVIHQLQHTLRISGMAAFLYRK